MKRGESAIALYGNVKMLRARCPKCGVTSLVIRGCTACCELEPESEPRQWQRMSQPLFARRRPPKEEAKRILAEQNGCCLYCERTLGSFVHYKGRLRQLRLCWDHKVPWSHTMNNHEDNFAAACHLCNAMKSNLIFANVEEVQVHVWRFYNADGQVRRMPETDGA